MQKLIIIVFALSILALQACVYRMDIAQGNRIDEDKLAQLKPGMSRSQVRLLIGEAAINDIHHPNHAHYVYYLYKGETRSSELKTMILTYDDNGVLTDIEGSL